MKDDVFHTLQAHIDELMRRYTAVKNENKILKEANELQKNELQQVREELAILKREHKNLQLAHALTEDSPQRAQAKRKVTHLIHLVEQAIKNVAE